MTDDSLESSGHTQLEEQAAEILGSETEPIDLIQQLDFGSLEIQDAYAEWHASTTLLPMLRALFLKELEDYSFSALHRRLDSSPEDAVSLGIESVPARTTFGRAWRDRIDEELQQAIKSNAKQIRELGHERGSPIGLNAVEPEDKSDVSDRTKDRYINRKVKEVTEEMQRLVFPAFDFDRAENAHYDDDAFLELQSHLGLTQSAAESGTDLYDQDTPRPEGAPDGDTHLHNVKHLDQERVLSMLDEANERMLEQARGQLNLDRPVDVAIDMTYLAYYGDRDGMEMVMGAPPSKSYEWCFKFATLTVVGEDVKFTLAMTPVWKGRGNTEPVLELIQKARKLVTIGAVYADAEFCSVGVLQVLDDFGCGYVIRSGRTLRTEKEVEKMTGDFRVATDFSFHGRVDQSQSGMIDKHTNLVLLPSRKDPEKTVRFVTNHDVSDESEAARQKAKGVIDRYSRRWGIENSYKTIKDFLAWTTSKEFVVRLFYFGFAVLLYNMWLLVDLLVQVSLDVDRRNKPRVTAKRFLNLARKQLREPG